jgi:two-component system response regulator EvgA
MAMRCDGESCLELLSEMQVREEKASRIVFLERDEPDDAIAVVKAGAAAVVSKARTAEELVQVIRKIDAGDRYVDHVIAMQMIFRAEQGADHAPNFSRNEQQILQMLADNKTMIEIAEMLHIAYKTVVVSCTRLKKKLRINDTEEFLQYARERFHSDQPAFPSFDATH